MKTRVAIAGLGGVADRIHLPACRAVTEIEVVAASDPNPRARDRMSTKYGIPQMFPSTREMLVETQPGVVIVGTPPSSHFEICSQALEAGAHVFCEKPFMRTLDEAERIIEMASLHKRLLRVNNQYRFMSFYRETKRRLDAGEFGRLLYIQCWQQMFHPPVKETNWRNQLKNYLIFEFGTHALDLASFFFDALPESIQAHTPRVPGYDADVLVQMALRFPSQGLAVFSFNRVSHAPEKYLEMRLDCERASLRLSLGGVARLGIEWSRAAGRPVLKAGFVKGGQAREERDGKPRTYVSSAKGEFATATAEHLKYFLAEIAQPVRTLEGAKHAREILRLVFAAYESAASGETVWLSRTGIPTPA